MNIKVTKKIIKMLSVKNHQHLRFLVKALTMNNDINRNCYQFIQFLLKNM